MEAFLIKKSHATKNQQDPHIEHAVGPGIGTDNVKHQDNRQFVSLRHLRDPCSSL
jgi:hypothetical protein